MRIIELSNGERYGTNNNEGGLFRQNSKTGEWYQIRGNSQTPNFKTANSFYIFLKIHFADWFGQFEKMPTMEKSFNWESETEVK